jgi:hypothetical protein
MLVVGVPVPTAMTLRYDAEEFAVDAGNWLVKGERGDLWVLTAEEWQALGADDNAILPCEAAIQAELYAMLSRGKKSDGR